jgi:hypothetical protein
MAQFLNQEVEPELSGFNRMGKPISKASREAGYRHAKEMGLSKARAFECVQSVAEALERDEPHDAMAAGTKFLDLTGTYRLMAVLLTT